jgi:hypothetical protein
LISRKVRCAFSTHQIICQRWCVKRRDAPYRSLPGRNGPAWTKGGTISRPSWEWCVKTTGRAYQIPSGSIEGGVPSRCCPFRRELPTTTANDAVIAVTTIPKPSHPGTVKKMNPNDPDSSRSESGAENARGAHVPPGGAGARDRRPLRTLSAGDDQISLLSQPLPGSPAPFSYTNYETCHIFQFSSARPPLIL